MKKVFSGLAVMAAIMACPAGAQQADAGDAPRGTYLVYAEDDGVAFASVEPSLAESARWPMSLHYFRDGEPAGAVRAVATANCAAGQASARITDALDGTGASMDVDVGGMAPVTFDRASNSAGDMAIVDFLCGDASGRLAQSSAPIFSTPSVTAQLYVALRAAGLPDRLARDIAIRDPETTEALVGTAVPEELRDRVRAILETPN